MADFSLLSSLAANVLFLRGTISIHIDQSEISQDDLLSLVANQLFETKEVGLF